MPHPALASVDHRDTPLPRKAWHFAQVWEDLAFLHWPVPVRELRTRVPLPLTIDTFQGEAWLGIVPFRLRLRPRGLPSVPRVLIFPEINVRTYVRHEGVPGVWFFSLDAPSRFAIATARRFFHLPYFHSRFTMTADGEGIRYTSERLESPRPAEFRGRYRPTGAPTPAVAGSLDHFLTERYRLFAVDRVGRVHRTEVHHPPWPLAPAEADLDAVTLTEPLGLALEGAPRAAFARRIEVVNWLPRRVAERDEASR